jgi:hypothetical protein
MPSQPCFRLPDRGHPLAQIHGVARIRAFLLAGGTFSGTGCFGAGDGDGLRSGTAGFGMTSGTSMGCEPGWCALIMQLLLQLAQQSWNSVPAIPRTLKAESAFPPIFRLERAPE